MDAIFGYGNFLNEIVWHYQAGTKPRTAFGRKHDTVFSYKLRLNTFNRQPKPVNDPKRYKHVDKVGRRYDVNGQGNRYYLDQGQTCDDVWTYIQEKQFQQLNSQAKERLGYPTQKPLALLDRIIKASSSKGDLVLDPFCGCGTTIESAARLGRQWAGIDISSFAIGMIQDKRLRRLGIILSTQGIPYDLVSARKLSVESPFNFESWAIARIPGFSPNIKQVADGGIDGRATLATKPENFDSRRALAQTKGGRFNLSNFRDFCHVIEREKAALGCFITLDDVGSQAARTEAAGCGRIRVSGYPYKRMNMWAISDYFGDKGLPRLPIMNDPFTGKPMSQSDLFASI